MIFKTKSSYQILLISKFKESKVTWFVSSNWNLSFCQQNSCRGTDRSQGATSWMILKLCLCLINSKLLTYCTYPWDEVIIFVVVVIHSLSWWHGLGILSSGCSQELPWLVLSCGWHLTQPKGHSNWSPLRESACSSSSSLPAPNTTVQWVWDPGVEHSNT